MAPQAKKNELKVTDMCGFRWDPLSDVCNLNTGIRIKGTLKIPFSTPTSRKRYVNPE